MQTHRFMQVLNKSVFKLLEKEADKRGITVQEYIRAIVVPQHIQIIHADPQSVRRFDHANRAKKGWETRRKNQENAEIQAKSLVYPGEPSK